MNKYEVYKVKVTSEIWKHILLSVAERLRVPPGCLLNAVCCWAEYLHLPTYLHWIIENLCLLTQTNTADPRPNRDWPIERRGGRGGLMQFVWHGALGNQMEGSLTYLKQLSLFTSAPKAVSDKGGGRNMLARANYHGFHVVSVLSDPPTLQNVMEAEAKCSRPSPLTCSHSSQDKVCAGDKGAGPSHSRPEDCGIHKILLLPITGVRILDAE